MLKAADYTVAVNLATETADIYCRCHGRSMWNKDDRDVAEQELARLLQRPEPAYGNSFASTFH